MWLFWCIGVLFIAVGVLTAVYLIYLQLRRGMSGFSILSTSDALVLTVVGVMFILNRVNSMNFNNEFAYYNETLSTGRQLNSVTNNKCEYRKVLLSYALFFVPFLNAFISMIAQTTECYVNIKRMASTQVKDSARSQTSKVTRPTIKTKTANDNVKKSKSTEYEHLRGVPTLISEMELVIKDPAKLKKIERDAVDESQPSTSTAKETLDAFLTSTFPKLREQSNTSSSQSSHDKVKPCAGKSETNKYGNYRRVGISVFSQWLLPFVAISVLMLSKVEEHNLDTIRNDEENICYLDNLASDLRLSQECVEDVLQENYFKTLIEKPVRSAANLEMMKHYSANKNTTEIERMTSMIIGKIYSHVDEFNRTSDTRKYSNFKSTGLKIPMIQKRQASLSDFYRNLPEGKKKNKNTTQITLPTAPRTFILNNATNRTRFQMYAKQDGNIDYFDEVPVDYVQPTKSKQERDKAEGKEEEDDEEEEVETDNKNESAEESTADENSNEEEGAGSEDDAVRDDATREENDEVKEEEIDEVKQEEIDEVKQEEIDEVKQEEIDEVKEEDIDEVKEEEIDEVKQYENEDAPISIAATTDSVPVGLPTIPDPTDAIYVILSSLATASQSGFISTQSSKPFGINSTPVPTINKQLNIIEPLKNIKNCVKSCYISNNFLKVYLFVLLFVGYFMPVTVAIVIYLLTEKYVGDSVIRSNDDLPLGSVNHEKDPICSSMSCIAKIVKQFIVVNIIMWTPTFLELLLRVWFCLKPPEWVILLLFFIGQGHGVVRNLLNIKLVQADSRDRRNKSFGTGLACKSDGTIHPILSQGHKGDQMKEDSLFVKSKITEKMFPLSKETV